MEKRLTPPWPLMGTARVTFDAMEYLPEDKLVEVVAELYPLKGPISSVSSGSLGQDRLVPMEAAVLMSNSPRLRSAWLKHHLRHGGPESDLLALTWAFKLGEASWLVPLLERKPDGGLTSFQSRTYLQCFGEMPNLEVASEKKVFDLLTRKLDRTTLLDASKKDPVSPLSHGLIAACQSDRPNRLKQLESLGEEVGSIHLDEALNYGAHQVTAELLSRPGLVSSGLGRFPYLIVNVRTKLGAVDFTAFSDPGVPLETEAGHTEAEIAHMLKTLLSGPPELSVPLRGELLESESQFETEKMWVLVQNVLLETGTGPSRSKKRRIGRL